GVWRVYSSDPAFDTRDGLAPDFKQYAALYDTTPVQGSGNGALYRIAPSLTPSLTGTIGKIYDGTDTAALTPANYAVTGAIDGDSVVVGNGSAAYDTRNAGTGKLVGATGIGIASATQGAIPVYGYALSDAAAAAPIGTIVPAALSLGATADSKVYDGSTRSSAMPVVSGLVAGDSVTSLTQTFDGSAAGARTLGISTYTINDGNGGANYQVTALTAAGRIAPAPLVVTADDKGRTTWQPNPALTASYDGLVAGQTPADLTGTLVLTTAATPSSPAGSYAIVAGGQSSANYSIRYVDGTLRIAPALGNGPTPPDSSQSQRDARLLAASIFFAPGCRPPAEQAHTCLGETACRPKLPPCD